MLVNLVAEIIELNSEIISSSSGSWNKYFSFTIKEATEIKNYGKDIHPHIKCYYMVNDVFKGKEIAGSLHQWDKVFISGSPKYNIYTSREWKAFIKITLFIQSIDVITRKTSMIANEEIANSDDAITKNLWKNTLINKENVEIKEKIMNKEEKQEFNQSVSDVLSVVFPWKHEDLPF